MRLMEDKDKWLAFDYSKTWPAPEADESGRLTYYSEMLNITVFNDNDCSNRERTEICFDTAQGGGNEMHLDFEAWNSKGPQVYGVEASRVVITLQGSNEASSFFEAMRRMVQAYDLRRTIGD